MTAQKHSHIILLSLLCVLLASTAIVGCIHNDLPYPRIQANFTSFEVDGQTAGAQIDSASRTVSLTLGEETDIYQVRVENYTITPGAELVEDIFTQPLNLTSPVFVVLKNYYEWQWEIKATQDIERYIEIENQMGSPVFDVPARRVIVYVAAKADLSQLTVKRAKLANIGATMTPDISQNAVVDARKPLEVRVEVFGHSQLWTIYFETVDASVETVGVDAWTRVAWVYGTAEAGKDNGVEYRLQGDTEWVRVPQSNVTSNGGDFTARIDHLDPETSYEARTYSDLDIGETVKFTTGTAPQLPNSNFDNWWLNGKVWEPWGEDQTPFWDTGNVGATTLGTSNTVPTEDTPTGSGWAAKLETRFVGIGIIGKLAAGNLFAGSYVRTDGTNGVLSFGRPFTERPTKLKGMYKYNMADISHSSKEFASLVGRPDTCIIWCALIDSSEPFEIRTNPNNRNLFDPDGPEVVAYGKMQQSQSVTEYIPFEFELTYKSTSRVPKYILVVASASKYGDYFTGGAGSILYIDDFELIYDY